MTLPGAALVLTFWLVTTMHERAHSGLGGAPTKAGGSNASLCFESALQGLTIEILAANSLGGRLVRRPCCIIGAWVGSPPGAPWTRSRSGNGK